MRIISLSSIAHNGAQIFVTLKHDNAALVAQETNLLYNNGYVCEIPDDFKAGIDSVVTLPTNQYRLKKVAHALAVATVVRARDKRRVRVAAAVQEKANRILEAIKRDFAPMKGELSGARVEKQEMPLRFEVPAF